MNCKRVALFIFVYVTVVGPLNEVLALASKKRSHFTTHENDNVIKQPCDTCPGQSECVPKIRCPAHMTPGGLSPECHLKDKGHIGVCCFTGASYDAANKTSSRTPDPKTDQYLISLHKRSQTRLEELFRRTEQLLKHSRIIVSNSAPEFGHHLVSFTTAKGQDRKLGEGGFLNLLTAQDLSDQANDDDELFLGYTQHTAPYCPPQPKCANPPNQYRTFSGDCNNPAKPSWGAANTGFERILPPDYRDGVWSFRTSDADLPLPSPRSISRTLILDDDHPSYTHNLMFMQFGQFMTHDMARTAAFSIGQNSAISCCTPEGGSLPPEKMHFACAPITVDAADDFFRYFNKTCLNFVRAQIAPATDCFIGYTKQMNGATHYLDLSHLYGITPEKIATLRGPGGLLKTFNDFGRELPPLTNATECIAAKEGGVCFASGDNRGNQIISLTAIHTLFTREHNRLAKEMTRCNPHWDEDKVFMESRRILQAKFQHIIYNEWLPLLLSPQLLDMYDLVPSAGYSTSYDPRVKPALVGEFSTAAMRFGHSTVDGHINIPNPKTGKHESIFIPDVMFEPSRLRLRYFLDRLLNGMMHQPMQNVDPFVSVGGDGRNAMTWHRIAPVMGTSYVDVTCVLTRYMFRGANPFGVDLASINVQRGRDFGLRSYNEYRRLCGLKPYDDFSQFPPKTAKRLSSVYDSPEDIDLWVGGLLEHKLDGSVVGPTFGHIIAEQFSRLKRGDRYFYEYGSDINPSAFTPSQLAEIKKTSLARIICDNKDGVELTSIPPNAFLRADLPRNTPCHCDNYDAIPSVDLSRFKEI